jgi:hypothetical protein
MTPPRQLLVCAWLVLAIGSAGAASPALDPRQLEFFEKKVRPVLVEHCYKCHSEEARKSRKLRGGLLLDSRAGLLKGGDSGPAIVPGQAKDSLLIRSLSHEGDVKMPPKGKLPAGVIADLETWVNQGAPDPRSGAVVVKQTGLSLEEGRKFWSYRPIVRPPVPPLGEETEIDAFLHAGLREKGLQSAPLAEKSVLVRRLYYDLIGLPPTPEEVERFVNDTRPDAYERLVDRLLASPGYGERWGRHWLDVARYAESLTLRGFILPDAWRYRDYVLDTFNEDRPLDRFIQEQVAGDLLEANGTEERRRALIATSFLTLGNTNLEEQDKKQLEMDVVDEQLDTLGRAFLAQTLGCARCHDHKFDPIPTKDYYALAGILKNTRTLTHANLSQGITVPLPVEPQREKALQEHEAAVAKLTAEVNVLRATVGRKPGKTGVRAVKDLPGIVVDDTRAKKVGTWTESKFSGNYVGDGYVHDGNTGKGEKTITFHPEIARTGRYEVRLAYVPATNRAANVPVTVFSADGEKTIEVDQRRTPPIDGLFLSLGQYKFENSGAGFVIVSNAGTNGHVVADAVVFIPVEKLGEETSPAVTGEKGDADKLRRMEAELKRLATTGPRRDTVLGVVEEKTIADIRVHLRGSVHNLGEEAPRGFLRVASRGSSVALPKTQSGRRELAEWLTGRDNPLTARVLVNRVWHWLFGAGLVRTVDNFGTTGEMPSHPELLDWLAVRFVEDGWSVKKLVRRIVLSHAYRQSSASSERARAVDPDNRLLSHANRRRLEAEAIRETLLLVSGQLTRDRGGPTWRLGLMADYGYRHTDTRRSVYSPVFRNSLPEIFEVFDFADPSVSTGRRNVSTVVPQALFLTNHPFVLEQARAAARRLLAETEGATEARLERAYQVTLGRAPTQRERALVDRYLGSGGEEEWAQVFGVLFASVDFRYVD